MKVSLDEKELRFCGRWDLRNPQKPEMIFPASSLQFRFYGRTASVSVLNRRGYWKNALGAIVDGVQKRFELKEEGETLLLLVEEETEAEHEVLLFKRMDASHEAVILKLELSEGSRLLPLPPRPKLRMEVYGDSISAGEVSEAVHCVGREDPAHNGEFSNSWYSYAWLTARKLGAELHDIAQGGAALLDGTGWFHEPDLMGMESIWDKVHYNPVFGEAVEWDFSKYVPHIVIVALGQNDSHPVDIMKDYGGEQAVYWRKRYGQFLKKLREKYPDAYIICCTTLMYHDAAWDRAIDQVCRKMGDDRIRHYVFRRNGKGTPGHLRIPEAEEMADELVKYIEKGL